MQKGERAEILGLTETKWNAIKWALSTADNHQTA